MKLALSSLASLALLASLGCSSATQSPLTSEPLPSDGAATRDAAGFGDFCFKPTINGVTAAGLYSGAVVAPTATVWNNPAFFSWDFGGGATPNTSTLRNPSVVLGAPGTYNGSFFASNACGSTTFPFTYTVLANPWTSKTGPTTAGQTVYMSDITLFNGLPAMAYYNNTTGDLKFATAFNAEPFGSEWNLMSVDTTGDTGWFPQLQVDPGNRLKIVYYDLTNADLKIAQAVPLVPTSQAHWNVTLIDSAGDVGARPDFQYSQGDLMVSYYDATNQNLKTKAVFIGDFPTGPASWVDLGLPTLSGDDGYFNSMTCANGNISLAYSAANGEVRFATGSATAFPGWTRYALETTNINNGMPASTTGANGNPVVAFPGTGNLLRIAQATSPTPTSTAGWTFHTAMDHHAVLFVNQATLSEGKLAVSYFGSINQQGHIQIAQTNSTNPSNKGQWYSASVTPATESGAYHGLLNTPRAGADQLCLSFITGNNQLSFGWRY